MEQRRYGIDYFLSNRFFISWVKNPDEENTISWDKWLRNHPESQEAFHRAKGIVERIHFRDHSDIGRRKEEIFNRILKDETSKHYRVGGQKKASLRKQIPFAFRLLAACVSLFLIATYIFWSIPLDRSDEVLSNALVIKENPEGQKSAFYLPDKSRVVLNSGSRISFPEQFGENSREVFLEGEAYFDVTHDSLKTFLVHSGPVVTEVHGTAFNVKAFQGKPLSVALERGSVSVYLQNQINLTPHQYLKPGQMLQVHEEFDKSVIVSFDHEQQFGWKDGKLVFKRADMPTLVMQLERWYGVEITVLGHPSEEWQVSGTFEDESLENVLEGIRYARNITYKIEGHQVTINTNP